MTAVTRDDLEKAWNEGVHHGNRGAAVKALEAATGTMFTFEVPDDKLPAGLAALKKVIGSTGPQVRASALAKATTRRAPFKTN
jgi:hypothetical protein